MATPYKMKGSPMQRNFGIGSPLHVEPKKKQTMYEFYKNVASKAYDKASQVGMGLKAAANETFRNIDPQDFRVDKRRIGEKFMKGYNEEKKADE